MIPKYTYRTQLDRANACMRALMHHSPKRKLTMLQATSICTKSVGKRPSPTWRRITGKTMLKRTRQ